tara:strand:- start:5206 stop:5691 length:486 start_codon:yes stop_codon:yes gene_type:complete
MASSTKTINHSTGGSWGVQCAEFVFDYSQVGDMSAVDFTLNGELKLPANSYVFDVQVHAETLWVSGAGATIIVGDDSDADGYVASTNLKATDLLAGETNTVEHPGGKAGAYLASEQRKFYSSSARTITATVTLATDATAATAGKTRVLIMYACAPVDTVTP